MFIHQQWQMMDVLMFERQAKPRKDWSSNVRSRLNCGGIQ